jgi:acetyl esterase/lipase
MKANMIYIPETISDEAKRLLEEMQEGPGAVPSTPDLTDVQGWQREHQKREDAAIAENEAVRALFQPVIASATWDGIPGLDIRPKDWTDNGLVLIYLHGGGYTFFTPASTLTSSVPVAAATGIRVLSVDYTRAPAGNFMQVTAEVIAVYQSLLKAGYASGRIGIFGDSAGGGLAAGASLRMRDEGIPMPGALVLWSPWSDLTDTGDTYETLRHAEPGYLYEKHLKSRALGYAGPNDLKHPYASPVYGDYSKGFPPTLIQGGTKESFLSNFVRHYQAIDTAGQFARLDLYEGMWHVFQEYYSLPEAKLAVKKMNDFLKVHLK